MIRDMSISPSADQEHLICLTSTNLIFMIKMEKGEKDLEEPKFELISSQAHEGSITCMDICIRKPLIVTCGEDQYIRIWNYKEKVQELAKQFPAEDISSVALHPSGLHILVGFSDKLKYFNIGTERGEIFKLLCDFQIRACPEVRFSHGGQYFAAVFQIPGQQAQEINVYQSYSCTKFNPSKSQIPVEYKVSNNGVLCIKWSRDDRYLICCGEAKDVVVWQLLTGEKFEHF